MPKAGDGQALKAGTRLDVYEVEEVLGTGGFGITYRARDHNLACSVAIKEYFPGHLAYRDTDRATLLARSSDQEDTYRWGLKRFLDEARTLARFKEPGIVRVNRLFETNGTAYLVMDYVEGISLEMQLRQHGLLDEQTAARMLRPLLEGLRALHAQNILHRDIKPGNIYLREDGSPVLLDFGAAREALEGETAAMTLIVTPGYAPMEQYTRDERQGPWSDLYALGATLFHCLSGRPPMAAPDRLSHRLDNRPDPFRPHLDALVGRLSAPFVSLLGDLLALTIAERPQSAEEVLTRLGDAPTLAGDTLLLDLRTTRVNPAALSSGRSQHPSTVADREVDIGPVSAASLSVGELQRIARRAGGVLAERAVVPALQRAITADEVIEHLLAFIGDADARHEFQRHARVLVKAAGGGPPSSQRWPSAPASSQRSAPLSAPVSSRRSAPVLDTPTVFAIPSGAPETMAAPAGRSTIDQDFLDQIEQRLAETLGPIAKMLVQRAAPRAASHGDLVRMLAEELDDESERARFTRGLL